MKLVEHGKINGIVRGVGGDGGRLVREESCLPFWNLRDADRCKQPILVTVSVDTSTRAFTVVQFFPGFVDLLGGRALVNRPLVSKPVSELDRLVFYGALSGSC